ncbi:MAG: hypothetical protein PVH29_02460 [Candidatus Zixiibacteriota bacterium]|jgi:hypothetical protein
MKKLITVLAVIALLAVACGDEEVTEPDLHYRVLPTSPKQVLVNVTTAFNQHDANLLRAMLSEKFVFYFNPSDVGQNPPGGSMYVIPESWNYTEFWQALSIMFDLAYSIDLAIPTGSIGEPASGAETYRAENVTISLLVMVDELNGYIANQGYCDFAFEKYKGADGHDYWRLTGWWDNTAMAYNEPAAGGTSLGRVLALYF